ncbi:MAG: CarD family transcriptional regulator [Propionibacteriaceae bacterium]|nr:CarD family transcriptional regulator [Propionibacteriaceae bacterium]
MEFTEGQTVIHPHHGPALVTGSTTRKVRGEAVDYLELEIRETGMSVCLPVAKAEEIGLRKVAGASLLEELVSVLCGPSCEQESQWSRRMKAQRMEVATGDPTRIAGVVRDLVRRREERGLSLAEKELLKEASAPLVAEIAIAVSVTPDQARAVMQTLVLEGSSDVLDRIDEVEPVAA